MTAARRGLPVSRHVSDADVLNSPATGDGRYSRATPHTTSHGFPPQRASAGSSGHPSSVLRQCADVLPRSFRLIARYALCTRSNWPAQGHDCPTRSPHSSMCVLPSVRTRSRVRAAAVVPEGPIAVTTRPWLIRFVAATCLLLGIALLYGRWDRPRADAPPTPHLAAMMGLIMLPGATLAARRMERRIRRSQGA